MYSVCLWLFLADQTAQLLFPCISFFFFSLSPNIVHVCLQHSLDNAEYIKCGHSIFRWTAWTTLCLRISTGLIASFSNYRKVIVYIPFISTCKSMNRHTS